MADETELSVAELVQTLKRKGIPLPSEIGAFVVLEICEQMLDAPLEVRTQDIWLSEIGEVTLVPTQRYPVEEADAVRTLVALLSDLLVCAAPGVPPMLLELATQGPTNGDLRVLQLHDDLEASLVPLNRGATRRVLSRLIREARKQGARTSQRPATTLSSADLDAQFDALLDGGERSSGIGQEPRNRSDVGATTANMRRDTDPSMSPSGAFDVRDSLIDTRANPPLETDSAQDDAQARHSPAPSLPKPPRGSFGETAKVSAPSAPIRSAALPPPSAAERAAASEAASAAASAAASEPPARGRALRGEDLIDDSGEPRRYGSGVVFGGMLSFAALVLGIAYYTLGQQGSRKLLGLPDANAAAAAVAAEQAQPKPAAPKKQIGELRVTSDPARAQVFMLIGKGPALAKDLPMGIASEFIALAEGRAPARAVVPSDAAWETDADADAKRQPRYELAMQTSKTDSALEQADLGATLLPREPGTPTGRLGTVRVITTPPGAQVYQLIGFTPDVRVENLPLEGEHAQGYDLVVFEPGFTLQRVHVAAEDFKAEGADRVAQLELKLEAQKRKAH